MTGKYGSVAIVGPAFGKDSTMKVNCITCGHSLNLDDAYDDFDGLVRCYVCSGLFELKTSQGKVKSVKFAQPPQTKPAQAAKEPTGAKTF
jgi:hypothetical protein